MEDALLMVWLIGVMVLTLFSWTAINAATVDAGKKYPGFRWRWITDVVITFFILCWPVFVPLAIMFERRTRA